LDIAQTNYERTSEKLNSRLLSAEMDGIVTYVTDKTTPDYVEPFESLVVVADTKKLRLLMEKSDSNSLSGAELGMLAEVEWDDLQLTAKVTQTPSSAPTTEDDRLRERYARAIYLELEQ